MKLFKTKFACALGLAAGLSIASNEWDWATINQSGMRRLCLSHPHHSAEFLRSPVAVALPSVGLAVSFPEDPAVAAPRLEVTNLMISVEPDLDCRPCGD